MPWAQKGDAVTLPLGTTAPVVSAGDGIPTFQGDVSGTDKVLGAVGTAVNWELGSGTMADTALWDETKLEADLTSATAATINAIRQAFQIQRLYERDARGGTRYRELLKSHFQTETPDFRVQRPEFLGGGTSPLMVQPVAATTDNANAELGSLGAYGVATDSGLGFTKSFTEHCLIIGLVAARADLGYQQGLDRILSRSTRFDYYWPSLAHLGEQAVLNKEIYAQNDANDDLVFGYQERYAEYRYKPSKITGRMRSNVTTPLDAWHLVQDFSALPVLNDSFMQEAPPMDRIKAITDEPDFILDAHFSYKCTRPMPTYSVPGLIDHF